MKWLLTGIGMIVLAVVFARSASVIDQASSVDPIAPPPLSEMDSQWLEIVTIGHKPMYDDLANIWLLQILTSENLSKVDIARLYKTVTGVTRHLPKTESLYMFACFVFSFQLGRPEHCQQLSLDGLAAFPRSWRIPMTQGYVEMFKMRNKLKAAVWFRLAASRDRSPPHVRRLADRLLSENPPTPEELQGGFNLLGKIPGGSRFGEFLNNHQKNEGGSP